MVSRFEPRAKLLYGVRDGVDFAAKCALGARERFGEFTERGFANDEEVDVARVVLIASGHGPVDERQGHALSEGLEGAADHVSQATCLSDEAFELG